METGKLRNVLIYAIGILQELKDDGFVKGGIISLTPEGAQCYELLKASGFRATKKELDIAIRMIQLASVEAEGKEYGDMRSML